MDYFSNVCMPNRCTYCTYTTQYIIIVICNLFQYIIIIRITKKYLTLLNYVEVRTFNRYKLVKTK